MARFLLLHGLHGSQGRHWQRWLHARLAERGHEVAFPDLPDPDRPQLDRWLEALDAHLAGDRDELTVVCHSLGCILWLHHATRRRAPVARALLNAPPEPVPEAPTFFPAPVDAEAVAAAAGHTRIVCSDDDPYAPHGAARVYAEPLGVPVDLLPGRGHLNPDAGYGAWPTLEAWCIGAKNGVET